MDLLNIILSFGGAYLLGSIPTSVWFGKNFYGVDVRDFGSKNPGATNTFRVLGRGSGSFVLGIDIIKGYVAATLGSLLFIIGAIPMDQLELFKLVLGLTAVFGHIFSLFLGFKGGKGVATLLGVVLGITPMVALISILIFLLVLLISKYVSLGSILGTLSFPILLLSVPEFQPDNNLLVYFGFALFGLIVFTHRKNIQRLLKGTESKTYVFPTRKQD